MLVGARCITARGEWGRLMHGEQHVQQSEVIRAILLEDSPCCSMRPAPAARSPSPEEPP